MPKFSSDWFSHAIPDWEATFRQIGWDAEAPKTALEIGSFEGRSTVWILNNLLKHPDSRMYCVDTFQPEVESRSGMDTSSVLSTFSANVLETGQQQKLTVLRGPSFHMLSKLFAAGLQADFIYVDGSHFAPDVLEDLVLSFRLLKVGGLMICDDYLWSLEPAGEEDVLKSPKIAVDAFTTIYRRKIKFIHKQALYQLAFLKTRA